MSKVVEFVNYKHTGTTAALGFGTTTMPVDARWASSVGLKLAVGGAETVGLQVSYDQGATWSANLRPINVATRAIHTTSDLASGDYSFPDFPGGWLRLVKSAATESATVSMNIRS